MSMAQSRDGERTEIDELPNGPAAAAILAAGIGCAAVGILSFAGDASDAIGRLLNIYNPTGTLSGVTTVAIIIWLVAWFALTAHGARERLPWAGSMSPRLPCWRWASC